jgi:hypothetical protein
LEVLEPVPRDLKDLKDLLKVQRETEDTKDTKDLLQSDPLVQQVQQVHLEIMV